VAELKGIDMLIQRKARGEWSGDLRSGNGKIDASSGVLQGVPFTFATRFENAKGTNPEELIAAAHAACFSMAFANYLSQQGHVPETIVTHATISLEDGKIHTMHLETRGQVDGLDRDAFKRLADEAEKKCPVSNLLRPGLTIELDADLL
jgi:osmotically inducible protein OsmC